MTDFISQIIDTVLGIMNVPDIVLGALILISAWLGAKRGFFCTVINGIGRIAALIAAGAASKIFAPMVSVILVRPIVGEIIETRAADLAATMPEVVDNIEVYATNMAASVVESIAYFILFAIFLVLINQAIRIINKSFHLVKKFTPIGTLDRAAGLVLGGVIGILLCVLGLFVLKTFAPETFGVMGYLSPERLANTTLTAYLLSLIPSL